mgnify:FL=1
MNLALSISKNPHEEHSTGSSATSERVISSTTNAPCAEWIHDRVQICMETPPGWFTACSESINFEALVFFGVALSVAGI